MIYFKKIIILITISALLSNDINTNSNKDSIDIVIQKLLEDSNKVPDFTLKAHTGELYNIRSLEGKVVLINFWATWCGPCRAIAPVIDELHTELEGRAVIGKVNIDENSDTPVNYGVRNIPTLLIFKNGEVVDKVVGNQPKSKLLELLESHM